MSQNDCGNYWWLTDVKGLHAAPSCQSNIETEKPISSLMFHLAPFPCKQSPRSTSQHPNWALRNGEARHWAAEDGENKPVACIAVTSKDSSAMPCRAVPCHATPGKQTVTSTLGGPRLMPALSSFFSYTSFFTSVPFSPSPPSIWRDSSVESLCSQSLN